MYNIQCLALVAIAYPGIYLGIYLPFLSEKTTRVFQVGRYISRIFANLCQVLESNYEYNHMVLVKYL